LIPRKKGVGGRDLVPALPIISTLMADADQTGNE